MIPGIVYDDDIPNAIPLKQIKANVMDGKYRFSEEMVADLVKLMTRMKALLSQNSSFYMSCIEAETVLSPLFERISNGTFNPSSVEEIILS